MPAEIDARLVSLISQALNPNSEVGLLVVDSEESATQLAERIAAALGPHVVMRDDPREPTVAEVETAAQAMAEEGYGLFGDSRQRLETCRIAARVALCAAFAVRESVSEQGNG